MRRIDFSAQRGRPVERYGSTGTFAQQLGAGQGETAVHCIRFDPGGQIGAHPTGPAQLFLVVEGSAWVIGGDGARVELGPGEGVHLDAGEPHAKGSDAGATVMMIQCTEITCAQNMDRDT